VGIVELLTQTERWQPVLDCFTLCQVFQFQLQVRSFPCVPLD